MPTPTPPQPVETAPTITLDASIATDDKPADESTATTDTTEETKETEAAPADAEVETEEEGEETEESDPNAEDPEEEAPKARTPEARKAELSSEIRTLVAKKADLEREVASKNATVYQPQSAAELEEGGMDATLARVEALEQEQKMAAFNQHVSNLNANLNVESLQVMADFPVFDPESTTYDKALADRAKNVFLSAAKIQTDPKTGLVIESNVTPYDIYKAFAETHSAGAQTGKASGQKSAEKMLANAETTPSSAPKRGAKDPFVVGLLGDKYGDS